MLESGWALASADLGTYGQGLARWWRSWQAGGELIEVRFEPGGGAEDEHTRVAPAEIGECVRSGRRREEEGTSAAGHYLVADLDRQLTFEDVEAFGVGGVDVERRPAVVRGDDNFNNGKVAVTLLPAKADIHRRVGVWHICHGTASASRSWRVSPNFERRIINRASS
jgi:hypothetical protein